MGGARGLHRPKLLCLSALFASALGCTGTISDRQLGPNGVGGIGFDPNAGGASGAAGSGGTSDVPPGSNPGGIMPVCEATEPGATPLMKLSTLQYKNTVRDLLAMSGAASLIDRVESALDAVPSDSLGDSFRVLDNRISLEHVQAYFNVGVAVGNALRDDEALRAAVAGECAIEASLSETCARGFVERFGRLSYRRPLSRDEVDELEALNDGERTPAEAVRAMVIVALASPRFVNHVEIDGAAVNAGSDAMLQLSSYEIASRLSYLFWQTMPDAELLEAAADGSLATEAGFATQLARVFDDDRTRETIWQFWNEWLRLERFTGFETSRPGFQSLAQGQQVGEAGHEHYADMVDEIRTLTELFTFERGATVKALLETTESVTQSEDLARLYGAKPYDGSGDYPELPAGTRAGLLQRGALLVSNLETTNPFHRGALVRKNLLCDSLAQPDPNSLPPGSLDPPPITADQTTRERFQAKVEGNDTCQSCHVQFSNIGYALESFDALGRFRTTERVFDEQTGEPLAELPIDAAGVTRIELDDADPVMDAAELNARIVASEKVEACIAKRYFSFAMRRDAQRESVDSCTLDDLAAALKDPQAGLAEAFARIARHPSFFLRKVGEP
jgi:hypothetical protein